MLDRLPNPFVYFPENRFVLDEDVFAAAIEPSPAFLAAPRPEYLRAVELMPIVEVLMAHSWPSRTRTAQA
jgi:hypothetical protein